MYTIKNYISIILISALFISCDSFTEVDFPKNELTGQIVFEDVAATEAAMANLYAKIREKGTLSGSFFGMPYLMGTYSDELVYLGSASNEANQFYTNSVFPTNEMLYAMWQETYNQIYEANRIIEGMEGNDILPLSFTNQIRAEALSIRALLHFNLSQIFGNVPYCTTTDYETNSTIVRHNVSEVYAQTILDLEMAREIMGANERGQDHIYINSVAVTSLLARIYAYQGQWQQVLENTSAIFQNSDYHLHPDLGSAFHKNNPSTIWQLHTGASNRNTLEASTHYIATAPPQNSALSQELVQSFDPMDQRASQWISSISDVSGNVWYYASKYKQRDGLTTTEYSIQLKLEEIYLLHAEALIHTGDINGSQEAINVIRNRAGLPNTTANTAESLATALEQERRWELFCEGAHRWLDLKRWDRLDEVIALVKPNWIPTDALLPIPDRELLANQNLLPQNPGY